MISDMQTVLAQTIVRQQKLRPNQIDRLIQIAACAQFPADLLPIDPSLWGSFWQFDVLAPGSSLPAGELALLRAARLDQSWPTDTTLFQFLADLHAAITHPQTGIWTTTLAGQPCAIFAAVSSQPSAVILHPSSLIPHPLVVWYCLTTNCLHAGYHTAAFAAHFAGLTLQRPPGYALDAVPTPPPAWLAESLAQREDEPDSSLAAWLDMEILRWRVR